MRAPRGYLDPPSLTVSKRYLPWLFRLHRVSSPSSLRFRLPSALRIAMTEVLVHNRQLLLLFSLLHRTIFLACCLFATGTLGAMFLVAGLQRISELRGSQLRSGLSLRATRYFYGGFLVELGAQLERSIRTHLSNTNNRELYPTSIFGLHLVCVHARPLEKRIRTDPSLAHGLE